MAYCSKCGTQLSDGTNFCPKCGTPCGNASSQSAEASVVKQKESSKFSSKALLLVILIIALIGGGWFAWKKLVNDYSLEGLAKALPKYNMVGEFHCGRASVIKYEGETEDSEWKQGYIDKMGNEVIPCKYVGLEMVNYDFHEGLVAVYNGNNWGYIDVDGNEVTDFIYDEAGFFSEGYAVTRRGDNYFIVNKSGKEVAEFGYSVNLDSWETNHFSEGLILVYDNNRLGYLNTKGELVIPCKLESSEQSSLFSEGLAVAYKGGKHGFIDKTGKEVIPFVYDEANEFSDGLAAVSKDGESFYINKEGQKVLSTNCLYGGGFHDGYAVEKSEDGDTYYYIDKTGKNVFNTKFEFCNSFNNGYARIGKWENENNHQDILWGFIDKNGKEVIPCKYKDCYTLSEGLARVIQDGDIYGFVDIHGKSTFDIENEDTKQLLQQKRQEKEEKRKRIEEEERRRGIDKIVTLSFTRPFKNSKSNLSYSSNYGAIMTASPNVYVMTDYIQIPSGKVWIYERYKKVEGGPGRPFLLYYSRESGALRDRLDSYNSQYFLEDGGLPILRPGDGFRICFSPFYDAGTKSIEVYFKEKDENYY